MFGFRGHVTLRARNASVMGLTGHPALLCRAAHPLLPALTSPHGQEEQRLEPIRRSRSASFLTPLASGNGEDGRELGLFGCRASPRCPLSREDAFGALFPPLRDGFSASGAGWSSTGPGLREAGSSSARGWVSSQSAQAPQGASTGGREVGPSLPPGPPWVDPASAQRPSV